MANSLCCKRIVISSSLLLVLSVICTNFITHLDAALLGLPNNLNVESRLILVDRKHDASVNLFKVQEYISRTDGSIKLSVLDVSESDKGKNQEDFFRLLEKNSNEKHEKFDDKLIAYAYKSNLCREERTSIWQLKGLTLLLNALYETSEETLRTKELQLDRTAIGPSALLQIVYENSEKFIYDVKAFDEIHLGDAYYFALRLKLADGGSSGGEAKLVVVVAEQHVDLESHDGAYKLELGKTRLSELGALGHVTAIGLVTDQSSAGDSSSNVDRIRTRSMSKSIQVSHLNKRSPELLDFWTYELPEGALGVLVSYSLVQKRSLSEHLGSDDSIFDLFVLPAGLGCGAVSEHRPLYLTDVRQFSGAFKALDDANEHFVAFDESSHHFRHDSGERKMIYSLKDKSVTLIRPAASLNSAAVISAASKINATESKSGGGDFEQTLSVSQQEEVASSNAAHEYHTHCAQTSLTDERESLALNAHAATSELAGILGAGKVALMYLGQKRLEPRDELSIRCHVFERQLLYEQVPLLIRLNMAHTLRPKNTKYTLVFYFVDETPPESQGGAPANLFMPNTYGSAAASMHAKAASVQLVDTMWLKRLELVSNNDILKYQIVDSRLTFSKFSWSLETTAEETRDRRSRLMHPTRTFDTLECWPARGQTQLDLVLAASSAASSDLSSGGTSSATTSSADQHMSSILAQESLEETLFEFILRQIDFPRLQVNDFELIEGAGEEDSTSSNVAQSSKQQWLVRAKLTKPFDFYYNSLYLVGWIKSLPALLYKDQAELVIEKAAMMTHHECALALATDSRLPTSASSSFYMLVCPLLGCAYVKESHQVQDELGDSPSGPAHLVDFVFASEPSSKQTVTLANYVDMCEVHLISRKHTSSSIMNGRFELDKVKPRLERAKLTLVEAPKSKEVQVTEVALGTPLDASVRDEQILKGFCYTLTTKLTKKSLRDRSDTNQTQHQSSMELKQKFVQLTLEAHQSRIHCHKACLLYQFCNSYSFNLARHQCTLSDVTPEQVHDSTIEMDNNQQYDCTIYAVNHGSLYKRRPYIIFSRPMDLLSSDATKSALIFGLSLEDCARLCHHNELVHSSSTSRTSQGNPIEGADKAKQVGCTDFSYMQIRALCIFSEPAAKSAIRASDHLKSGNQQQVPLESPEALKEYLGGNERRAYLQVETTSAQESYQRDFTQYYLVHHRVGLELKEATNEGSSLPIKEVSATVTKRTMNNLNLMECARECSIVQHNCVTFDHCTTVIKGVYTNLCYLYSIRSPLTIAGFLDASGGGSSIGGSIQTGKKLDSAKLEAKLTSAEANFYVANRSAEYEVSLASKDHCRHYYLDGDTLYLKRQLELAPRSYAGEDELIEPLAHELDLKAGEKHKEEDKDEDDLQGKESPTDIHEDSTTFFTPKVIYQLILSMLFGAFLVTFEAAGVTLIQRWRDARFSFPRGARPSVRSSTSSLENIIELVDM